MSFDSGSLVRFGNVGFLSVGVMAFALVTLQGCAAPMVTASSLKEPGVPVIGLGALRADDAPRATTRQPAERPVAVRSSQNHERGFRNSCRRCSQ